MLFEYQKLMNTVLDEVNFYDPVTETYPLEDKALQLAQDCYDQSDHLIESIKQIAESILSSCEPPGRIILRLSIVMDLAAKASNCLRMADEIDPLRDLGQKEKEPLEVNRENS